MDEIQAIVERAGPLKGEGSQFNLIIVVFLFQSENSKTYQHKFTQNVSIHS